MSILAVSLLQVLVNESKETPFSLHTVLHNFLQLPHQWLGGLGHFMVQKKGHPNGSVLEESFRPGWRLLEPLSGREASRPLVGLACPHGTAGRNL